MRYSVALAVFTLVLAGVGVAAAAPMAPNLTGHWVVATTVTEGNSIDQARIGNSADLYCVQSGEAMTCHSQDASIYLRGALEGSTVRMFGVWRGDGIQVTLDGALVNARQLQGHFATDMAVGWGDYQASGEWKADKVAD